MNYYSITHSLNRKIVGHFSQSDQIINNEQGNPKFLTNIFFERIDFPPILPVALLKKRAKVTDLISNVNAGGNLQLLMSAKFKQIIENKRDLGLQFFSTSIVHNDVSCPDFYSMNMFSDSNYLIDFNKSRIKYYKKANDYNISYKTNAEYLHVDSMEEFNKKRAEAIKNNETFHIDKLALNPDVDEDFFMLRNVEGGVKYVVSETLKSEIEDAGCTGIEFMPVELSLNEWLGEEREKIYGKA